MEPIFGMFIGLVTVICIFGLPWYYYHQRKMLEIKLRGGMASDSNVLKELQEMKQQIADLRDTTTRYDMSFDAALQRMESRMGMVEQRLSTVERSSQSVTTDRG
jgi:hypothetical protein